MTTKNPALQTRGRPSLTGRAARSPRFALSLDPGQLEAVQQIAEARGVSTATIIRLAVKKLVARDTYWKKVVANG